MISESKLANLIASDKKRLSQFILDLCGSTLDNADFDSKAYAFFLYVAFRHQAILQSKEWEAICAEAARVRESGKDPLDWSVENSALHKRIANFAQAIATEVDAASQDNDDLAVKLIKTCYLSHLDRARRSSEQAIRFINATNGRKIEDIAASTFMPDDPVGLQYTEALRAHTAYLDSLSSLPFVMERLCLSLAKNHANINYQPGKTAEMLAATLDTINAGLKLTGENERRDYLIKGLKLALEITMPNIQVADHQLVDEITEDLLPFINTLIDNTKNLEDKKAKIFTKNSDGSDSEEAKACKTLLAAMDVHFESVLDILTETLLEPVEQCATVATEAMGIANAAAAIAQTSNQIDRLVYINKAFANFDRIAAVSTELDPALLPAWLGQANDYYQQLKVNAAHIEAAAQVFLGGLGAFYNYAVSFIPESVRKYLNSTSALTKVLSAIDTEQNNFDVDKVMAYFAFYELAKQSGIKDPLKARFFEAYMSEVVKANNKLKLSAFSYEKYQLLEHQLDKKRDLQRPLANLITDFKSSSQDISQSMILDVNEALNISIPKLDILVLINRLQTLESKFDAKSPQPILDELTKAVKAVGQSPHQAHKVFAKEFLQPAMQRLLIQYQNEQLLPLLEEMLDTNSSNVSSARHQIRKIYSKLQENAEKERENRKKGIETTDYLTLSAKDWNTIEECRLKYENSSRANIIKAEMSSIKEIAAILPQNTKEPSNPNCPTSKEYIKDSVKASFDTAVPMIRNLLDIIHGQLDRQKDDCNSLKDLANNEKIVSICDKKLAYIDALNALLNEFEQQLQNNYQLREYIGQLLTGEALEKGKDQVIEEISSLSAPGKLIRFAWNVLPSATGKGPQLPERFIDNLFAHYLGEESKIAAVLNAEQEYNASLNSNPVPALMKELNDPLAVANIIPSQEKIMDAIVDQLVAAAGKTAFSWGINYARTALASITQENLTRLLPYPFLVNLAIQAVQSEAVQARIAPVINSLMNEYGGVVSEKAAAIREAAKKRLYPMLGVEIQKTIEESAWNYAYNPAAASETDRDAFAMYYLQYREIRQNNEDCDREKVIEFLFPELLKDKKTAEKQEISAAIATQFSFLDAILPAEQLHAALSVPTAMEETERQLLFLIQHLDMSDAANNNLILLALVNRLLIMTMETAEQLSEQDKVSQLQQQVINSLSSALEKINLKAAKEKEKENEVLPNSDAQENLNQEEDGLVREMNEFTLMELANGVSKTTQATSTAMFQALAGANKRATKMQLERVKSSLKNAQKIVEGERDNLQSMLDPKEPLLGISLAEWQYHQSKQSRRISTGLSIFLETVGFVFAWFTVISPFLVGGGILQSVFTFLGIAGAVGTAATGVGLVIAAAIALVRLAIKFGMEIWNRRDEFKSIPDNPSKYYLYPLLVLKCLGFALAKTFFTDYLVARGSTFLAFGPIARIRDAMRVWPTRDRVTEEESKLSQLNEKLTALQELIDKQIGFLENKADAKTGEPLTDQSSEIAKISHDLKGVIDATNSFLKTVNPNDARYSQKEYGKRLENYERAFTSLTKEVESLQKLQAAQVDLPKETVPAKLTMANEKVATKTEQVSTTTKPVVVDLEAYKKKMQQVQPRQAPVEQPGYISRFWGLFVAKAETPTSVPTDVSVSVLDEEAFYVIANPTGMREEDSELGSSYIMVEQEIVDSMLLKSFFAITSEKEDALLVAPVGKLEKTSAEEIVRVGQGPGFFNNNTQSNQEELQQPPTVSKNP